MHLNKNFGTFFHIHFQVFYNELCPKYSKSVKNTDIRYQKLESLIMKAAVSSIILMDSIKQGRKLDVSFLENAMTLAKDSVKLLFYANSDLTVHCKDLVRPELVKCYQQLANSDNVVSTKFLFGDNLEQQIRILTDVAKIGQKISSSAIRRHSRMSDRSRKSYDRSGQSSKHPYFCSRVGVSIFGRKEARHAPVVPHQT